MKTEIKANRRVHDVNLVQKRGEWNMKPWDGVIEVLIKYSSRGSLEWASLLINWEEDGSLRVKNSRQTNKIAPTTLVSLKKQLVEFIQENEEEIKSDILL